MAHPDVLVQEQRIVPLSTLDQPLHCPNDILPRWQLTRIPRLVRQDDNVRWIVPESFYHQPMSRPGALTTDELVDIVYVVDTSTQLTTCAKVVDADLSQISSAPLIGLLQDSPIGLFAFLDLGQLSIHSKPNWELRSQVEYSK